MPIDVKAKVKKLLDNAQLTKAEIGPHDYWGYFTDAYRESLGMEDTAPAIFLSDVDVEARDLRREKALTINGVVYKIREAKPSGNGWVKFSLEDQSS